MKKEKAETLLENYQALSELYSNIRNELDRTRKALDVAVERLGYIKNNYKNWTPDRDEQMIAQAVNGLDEIKQITETKENKDENKR